MLMSPRSLLCTAAVVLAAVALVPAPLAQTAGQSPWGPDDELGRLNLMTDASRAAVLSRVDPSAGVYDLGVEYYIGMPSWQAAGDPHYRMWMTHTPRGTVIDDPVGVGREENERVSYTGSAVSFYAHMGTHIDALVHFGLHGEVYNGFAADEHLGDRGWDRSGAETIPPLVARGVLVDVAAAKGVDRLPPLYRVTSDDLREALARQGTELRTGDVVLVRTGQMALYDDAQAFMTDPPGLDMDGARFLVEAGAMVIGADNLSLEAFPSETDENYIPMHTYLLAQHGIPILELVALDGLSEAGVYEFAFVGGSVKFRGADAAPIRPLALPLAD